MKLFIELTRIEEKSETIKHTLTEDLQMELIELPTEYVFDQIKKVFNFKPEEKRSQTKILNPAESFDYVKNKNIKRFCRSFVDFKKACATLISQSKEVNQNVEICFGVQSDDTLRCSILSGEENISISIYGKDLKVKESVNAGHKIKSTKIKDLTFEFCPWSFNVYKNNEKLANVSYCEWELQGCE